MKLFLQAVAKYVFGVLLVGVLIFSPAGTLQYPRGWCLMGVLFVPMFAAGIIMLIKSPELLKKRLDVQEKEKEQKMVILLSGIQFVACFIVSGLDFRFGWSQFPVWLTVLSCVLFLAAYALYAEVMRENVWLSRVVEVQEGQKVIDTGLYGVVRHPMYFSATLLFWAIPLVLGSWPAFAIMLFYPLLLAKRIRNEEKVLEEGLDGYRSYEEKVKYRLIPFVW